MSRGAGHIVPDHTEEQRGEAVQGRAPVPATQLD